MVERVQHQKQPKRIDEGSVLLQCKAAKPFFFLNTDVSGAKENYAEEGDGTLINYSSSVSFSEVQL